MTHRLPNREQRRAALRREDQEAQEIVLRLFLALIPLFYMLYEVATS